MREKLQLLMKSESLTASLLAEMLGIRPSGISHILNGRNKPSFDFVQKILRRFPNINPDWLLLDSEVMYRDQQKSDATQSGDGNLFNNAQNFAQGDNSVSNGIGGAHGGAYYNQGGQDVGGGLGNQAIGTQGLGSATTPMGATNSVGGDFNGSKSGYSQVGVHPWQNIAASAAHQSPQNMGYRRVKRVIVLFDDRTFESYEA